MELPDPPEGWGLKALIEIDETSWSASFWSADEYVYGFGSTARYAVLDALEKIDWGQTFARLSGGKRPEIDLLKFVKLEPKVRERDRRF
jgi:hypothetical protein